MSDETRVFSLHYFGARFSNNRLPVEVLPDLQAFRDLLLSYTKDEWRKRHPGRKNLPKNFSKELSLSLFAIEDGSAIPKLEWQRSSAQVSLFPLLDDFDDAVESAYTAVIELIDPASENPDKLTSEKLAALNKLGAALQDGEKIDFASRDGTGKIVSLDTKRRKELIVGARETYESRVEGSGELIGLTSPKDVRSQCYIELETKNLGKISLPVDRLQLYEEFAEYLNSEVQFDILVELDSGDKVKAVIDVFEVSLLEDPHAEVVATAKERLESFGHLQDGWNEGQGRRIDRRAINGALDFIVATRSTGADFRVFPTDSGGVLVDASTGQWEYSIEFEDDGAPEMYGVEIAGGGEMVPQQYPNVDAVIDDFIRRSATA